ncbi:secretogranin-3 precursor [Danio rerio]|uniref:secretogranin-3 precursor n=1 Tax=Danio rerio TaxID=7955 RepID=UPI00001D6E40|nr:secretogranin-3 precursor [Danio rerio]AAH59577.1 Secretogranin III [Danio rerio]|eukprot:NP_957051.1 secretogranin-3 precursor [Danio rerio]
MASKRLGFVVVLALVCQDISAFPTPAGPDDKYNRELTEEKPLEQQIAEADSIRKTESKPTPPAEEETNSEDDDITFLKALAEKSKESNNETPISDSANERLGADDADSTKNRRLADDYDSTKNGMDYKYQDDPESFRQLDGTPLTAQDIVQKIANKIYEEDDRGVFDRIVSKLLKLGLITDSQAETLEYEVAEALQDLITKNAKDNMIGDRSVDYPVSAAKDTQDEEDRPSPRFDEEDEVENEGGDDANGDEPQEEESRDDTVRSDDSWDAVSDGNDRNELNPEDGLQDLQFFPNFYRLLKSLDSEQDKEERETLITIMKTLIDFVKMMVKYGTITPEEGVTYLENLDAMIALQTKNKLGKSLVPLSITPPTGKAADDDDNTKTEAAKMQKEYESLKDSTKDVQTAAEISHPGKSESYLEAIRKNIEWLKKHNKEGNKEDYDLSKLRDFMDQQVDSYIDKGILEKDEGDVIKRIYGSL